LFYPLPGGFKPSGVKSISHFLVQHQPIDMNEEPIWSSENPTEPGPPLQSQDTQPSPRLTYRVSARSPHRPYGLYALTGCLALIVMLCACTSFLLASIGPVTLLSLRDRWLGRNLGETVSTIGQVAQIIIGNNDVWPVADNGRLTILLMGVDTRGQAVGDASRSDVIMLVTIDPASQSAAMLSIPRDLYVPLPNLDRQDRINTAYYYGTTYNLPGGGGGYAMQTIGWNLGVPIERYAVIDFDGFKKVIDAVGGVDINVPKEIVDNEYPTADYGTERLVIPAGLIHIDGDLALKYVRTRHADSDFGRLERQQQVLLAVRDKALSIGSLNKVPEVLNALGDSLQTDLTLPEILTLAKKWAAIPRENIRTYRIDQSMTQSYLTPSGAQVLLPVRDLIGQVVAQFLGPAPAPSSSTAQQ
jgi:LCP family protein required for cell wall assembly